MKLNQLRIFRYSLLVILLTSLLSCSSSFFNFRKSLSSYEIVGDFLASFYEEGKNKCDKKELSKEKCQELKVIYNRCREVYIANGEYLIDAINSENKYEREKALENFNDSWKDLSELISKLIRMNKNLQNN